VLAAMKEVVTRWLGQGVDGYRLDAVRYLVEDPDPQGALAQPELSDTAATHAVLRALRAAAAAAAPESLLIGEVWADVNTIARYRGAQDELQSCFHFPLASAILEGVRAGDPAPIAGAIAATLRTGVPASFFAPFLSNHDQKRSATVLKSDPLQLRLAAALLFAMPGPPFVYYGEELGMQESSDPRLKGDRAERAPMPWEVAALATADPASLRSDYRRLIRLRKCTPALREDFTQVLASSCSSVLVVLRGGSRGQAVLATYNFSSAPVVDAQVALPANYPAGEQVELLSGQKVAVVRDESREHYPLPALSARGAAFITAARGENCDRLRTVEVNRP